MAGKSEEQYRCSFCGKNSTQVRKLIAGRTRNTFICDECVDLCTEIISEELMEENFSEDIHLLKPREI